MDKKTMIDHLNNDLAGELGAIIQYLRILREWPLCAGGAGVGSRA
jgi:bacterioferritin (cytochrome b1)